MAITGLNIDLTVGPFTVNRLPKAVLTSERGAVAERLVLELPDTGGKIACGVSEKDAVDLFFAYRGGPSQQWRGQVTAIKAAADQVEITALSPELAFIETRVSECFRNETSRAVVSRLMALAGVGAGKLDGPEVTFPHLIFSGQAVFECFRQINDSLARVYKLDMSASQFWIDANGRGNWGDFDVSGPVPIVKGGDNLVSHNPRGESGTVTALLCPGLMHSQLFTLRDDRRVTHFTKRAISVRHQLGERDNLTIITYGREKGYA